LFRSAALHDIGKVAIPDAILLKPGRLTAEEFEIMKTHTTHGRDAIANAESILGTPDSFLAHARNIAYCHHERWDGNGYPLGLKGERIPLSARLMAIADVYDALISSRPYKEGMPHARAVAILREGRGSDFDPRILDIFLDINERFREIALTFRDAVTKGV
jgi:putative two-component system response regulator